MQGPIAQLVERPAHNRMVGGSTPSGPTIFPLSITRPETYTSPANHLTQALK